MLTECRAAPGQLRKGRSGLPRMRRRGFCCTCDIPGEKDLKDQGIREKGLDGAQHKQKTCTPQQSSSAPRLLQKTQRCASEALGAEAPNRAPERTALLLLSRKGDFCQASVKTKLVGIKALSSTSNERRFNTATTRTSPQRGRYPLKTWSHEPGPRSMVCSLHSQGKFWADPSPIPSPSPSPRLEAGSPEPGSPALIPDTKSPLCLQPSSRSPGM